MKRAIKRLFSEHPFFILLSFILAMSISLSWQYQHLINISDIHAKEMYDEGYNSGKSFGLDLGERNGKKVGNAEGFKEGYNKGSEEGYEKGYTIGRILYLSEVRFYRNNVAIVTTEGYRYHHYGCGHIQGSSFYIYNVELAKYKGYTPCLDCWESGIESLPKLSLPLPKKD